MNELLKIMLGNQRKRPAIYKAGDYWRSRAEKAVLKLAEVGIPDFRGHSGIGFGFVDCACDDVRTGTVLPRSTFVDRLVVKMPLTKGFSVLWMTRSR
jgi:hypothetical protein